ncbi:MauE/DoxX family redox-associated membrane protein [Lysobacter sp. D1-1-M9]|uniref:MauE/DoxX family redox-associated membrane protein n=1 Tax=Novilysobacter longmucuonensis TaxID=3098603 RepID=UPI002FC84962
MNQQRRLSISLLMLRLGVFVVMLVWTLDKFVRPDHTADVFSGFYGISGLDAQIAYVLGALELVLLLAFVVGFARRWSYGIVLVLHGVSTFSTWSHYFEPFEGSNLMFFAAWPMLAACAALYLLRDSDSYTLGSRKIAK